MSERLLDDFLKYGLEDATSPAARRMTHPRRSRVPVVDARRVAEAGRSGDEAGCQAVAVLEWMWHVDGGRIGQFDDYAPDTVIASICRRSRQWKAQAQWAG